MRVLQINTERTWRGGERQTLYTLEGLAALGARAELLCRAGGPLAERAAERGIRVHGVATQGAALSFLAARGRDFDVLHAQTAKGQTLSVLAKPAHRRPLVYTRRVDFVPAGALTRLKYAATDRVVAISGAIRDILAGFGVAGVEVIGSAARENPIAPDALQRLRAELFPDLAPGTRLLGTVAALVPHKDPLSMARAVQALRAARGEDFLFVHFGDGPLRPELEACIAERGLGRVYRPMGFSPRAVDAVQLFEAFAMSSREEGLGSTVLDAFLARVPVAATDAGGLAELVAGRGLVSPRENPEALAASLNTLLTDTALAATLAEAGREHAAACHAVPAMAAAYLRIYERLAGR